MPALFTTMSTRPNASIAHCTILCAESHSATLSVLTAADGYLIVPEDANGLSAGEPVEVIPYR